MRLSDHLAKSTWALIDKGLPMLYGLGMIFIVIRVLPKEEYGTFVIVQALFYFVMLIAQHFMTRPLIKVVSADNKNAEWAFPLVTANVVIIFSIGLAIISVLSKYIGILFRVNNFRSFLLILWILGIIFIPKTVILSYFGGKIQTFKVFLINSGYFLTSLFGLFLLNYKGLLSSAKSVFYVNIVGAGISSIIGILLIRKDLLTFNWKIAWVKMNELAAFGKFTLGYGLFRSIYQQADSYILAAMMGPIEVAIYNAAKTFLRFYNIMAQAIITLVFPVVSKLSGRNRTVEVKQVYEKSICFYSMLLIPINILLIIGAKYLFLFAYGDKYPGTVIVFQILILGTFFHPFASIGSATLLGLNRPDLNFYVKLITSAVNIILNIILIPIFMAKGAATTGSVTLALDGVILFLLIKRIIHVNIRGIISRTGDAYQFTLRLIRDFNNKIK